MPSDLRINADLEKENSFFISVISFVFAVLTQGGLLLGMWFFCFYSEHQNKPQFITISLDLCEEAPVKSYEQTIQPQEMPFEEPKPASEVPKEEPLIEEFIEEPIKENPIKEEPAVEELKPEPFIEEPKPELVKKPETMPEPPKEKPKKKLKPLKKLEKKIEPKPESEKKAEPKHVDLVETKPAEVKEVIIPQAQPVSEIVVAASAQPAMEDKTPSAKSLREIERYIARIAKMFEKRKKYPEAARKKHIQGVVTLKYYITLDGKIKNCKVINEPNEILEKAAIDLLNSLTIPKPPKDWEADKPIIYNIKYNIR